MKSYFITYQQAVRLKELGYMGNYIYHEETEFPCPVYILSFGYQERDNCFPAPTLFDVQLWLMDTKNIVIHPFPTSDVEYEGDIEKLTGKWDYNIYVDGFCKYIPHQGDIDSLGEALSDGIDKCLDILCLKKTNVTPSGIG